MTTKQSSVLATMPLQRRLEAMAEPPECDGRKKPPIACAHGIQEVVTIESNKLLQGGREIHILHEDEVYRLLVTRNNKLILQK